jgi:ribulose-phosphate 3-epimerase
MKFICDPHILPTNTCPSDLTELAEHSAGLAAFASAVQLDVSDGQFAPTTSWPFGEAQWSELERMSSAQELLPAAAELFYEAHLMVLKPHDIGVLLAGVGCRRILAHVETLSDAETAKAMFDAWKAAGAKEVGLAILIDTPLQNIAPYVEMCDAVQIMSIARIGAQGEAFDDRALSRVEELHARYPSLMVAVDGGVSEANIEELVRAGANRLCVGSAIAKSDNAKSAYERMYERAMRGCTPVNSKPIAANN